MQENLKRYKLWATWWFGGHLWQDTALGWLQASQCSI